jgi:predicted ArsR family transcriptional regulator
MGRTPTVSAEEVMQAIALHPEPVVTAKDINAELGLEPDGARERLKSLADDGYLEYKKPGGSALVFWMSDKGRRLLANMEDES